MSHLKKVAVFTTLVASMSAISNEGHTRGRSYPLTRCGPDLAYLCPIHGYFDLTPFHYSLAIYPGCIKVLPVETPRGTERRPVLVCG